MRRYFKQMLYTFAFLVLLAIAGGIQKSLEIERKGIERAFEQSIALEKHHPQILADLKRLAENPPFVRGPRAHDAGPYLASHISWSGDAPSFFQQAYKKISARITKVHEPAGLQAFAQDPEVSALDVKWVDGLLAFDHWKLSADPHLRHISEALAHADTFGRIALIAKLPSPEFMDIAGAARVRFAQLHQAGRTLEAFRLYHHVASLMNSTDDLVGAMTAASMLKLESAWAGFLRPHDWPVYSPEVVLAHRRTTWALAGVYMFTFVRSLPREFEPYLDREHVNCAAAHTALTSGFLIGARALEPRWPFESNYDENFTRARAFQDRLNRACDLGAYEALLSRSPASNTLPTDVPDMEGVGLGRILEKIPFARRATMLTVLTIAYPNFLRDY